MKLDLRVMEVDPIHRRIVLGVTNIPAEQPPRPETPSKIIPMEEYEAGSNVPIDMSAIPDED
jgi:small subunit ribosomal protein S1